MPEKKKLALSEKEIQYILAHYASKSLTDIAKELGRSKSGITGVKPRVGLSLKKVRPWTAKDVTTLFKSVSQGKSGFEISDFFGRQFYTVVREYNSIRRRFLTAFGPDMAMLAIEHPSSCQDCPLQKTTLCQGECPLSK